MKPDDETRAAMAARGVMGWIHMAPTMFAALFGIGLIVSLAMSRPISEEAVRKPIIFHAMAAELRHEIGGLPDPDEEKYWTPQYRRAMGDQASLVVQAIEFLDDESQYLDEEFDGISGVKLINDINELLKGDYSNDTQAREATQKAAALLDRLRRRFFAMALRNVPGKKTDCQELRDGARIQIDEYTKIVKSLAEAMDSAAPVQNKAQVRNLLSAGESACRTSRMTSIFVGCVADNETLRTDFLAAQMEAIQLCEEIEEALKSCKECPGARETVAKYRASITRRNVEINQNATYLTAALQH